MTATDARPSLPAFGGHAVDRAAVKITGAGTGLSDALKFDPVALDIGDEAYFVMRGVCAGVEHAEDRNEMLVRTHKIHTEQISPVDRDTAVQILAAAKERLDKKRAEIEGQLRLDDEAAAADAEKQDETGTPAEIAEAAKNRTEGQPG